MGGERVSTVHRIRAGKICAICRSSLPLPHRPGKQLCRSCREERGRHRVYMSFMLRTGWHVQFLEEDLKTPLSKRFTFQSQDKVLEMARKGGAAMNLESIQGLEHGIDLGRGGAWLELTSEQYARLKITGGHNSLEDAAK